jgi:ABC-2 type transport system ATP-binding protein
VIEVENLTKVFDRIKAIDGISFTVNKGEILGFLGPNGAGKTTTMRILTGYMPPTTGSARIAGMDILKDSIAIRKKIGYLPENPPLYLEMTVRSFLGFVSKIKGVPRSKRKSHIDAVIERCSLTEVRDRILGRLSKGYKQRVGLAQALINDPEILILDEPTIGLDPKQIIEVRALIKGLGGSHTILLSTHILPEVSMTCERIVIIDKGKVVAVDTPQSLTARLKGAERIYLEAEGPAEALAEKLQKIPGVLSIHVEKAVDSKTQFYVESELKSDVRREIAATVVGNGWGLLELRPITMSLEDIFLKLTTSDEVVQ